MPTPASAASSADAWMSARQVYVTNASAIGEAAVDLSAGGSPREVRQLRHTVATAVHAIDGLEVHACFQVWWSYVRSSYVLLDQALVGMEANDVAHAQSAATASRYMIAMATATPVECPRDDAILPSGSGLGPRGDLPLVTAIDAITSTS